MAGRTQARQMGRCSRGGRWPKLQTDLDVQSLSVRSRGGGPDTKAVVQRRLKILYSWVADPQRNNSILRRGCTNPRKCDGSGPHPRTRPRPVRLQQRFRGQQSEVILLSSRAVTRVLIQLFGSTPDNPCTAEVVRSTLRSQSQMKPLERMVCHVRLALWNRGKFISICPQTWPQPSA